jgi:SAM-dependent methyltransferase
MFELLNRKTPKLVKGLIPWRLRAYIRGQRGMKQQASILADESLALIKQPECQVVLDSPHKGLCELAGPRKYENAEWRAIHDDLASYSVDKHIFSPNVYRKGWEWTQAAYGLKKLGMLRTDYSALGVGAGREGLIFFLGDRLREVVATDLYGNDAWSSLHGREADSAVLNDASHFCPRPITPGRIRFLTMDGTRLEFPDSRFDISWSLSSIEHFGGHEKAAQAVREMARVTRVNGIVVIATEYLLLEEYHHPEYFNKQQLLEFVVQASPALELVEPIDFSLPPDEYLIDSIALPNGVHRRRRHVVLNDGRVQWTSIVLFMRKIKGS